MGRKRNTSDAPESAPKRQKKVMTLQEKVELLDMLQRLNSAAAVARHYGINESTVRYIKKKEEAIRDAVSVATPSGAKHLHVVRDPDISRVETATFMWVQDCYKKGIPVDSLVIREKAKSLYVTIKERDREASTGTGGTSTDFQASKGWFENFKKRFGPYNGKTTEAAASANQEAANEFPATLKELIEEKGYVPEQVIIDLMELSTTKAEAVPDQEEDVEAVPEDKFTLDNIAEGLHKLKALVDYFYDIDPSILRALKVKQAAEEAFSPYTNIYKELKKQKSQTKITMYFQKITPSTPASPTPSTSAITEEPKLTSTPASRSTSTSSAARRTTSQDGHPDNPLPMLE